MTERDGWREDYETVEIPPEPEPKPKTVKVEDLEPGVGRFKAKPNGHTAEETSGQEAPPVDLPARPVLIMQAGRRAKNVALCVRTLNKADVPMSVFSRGNIPVVVRVAADDEKIGKHGAKIHKGSAVIHTAHADHVLYALDHLLEGRRFKKNGKAVPADVTAILAKLTVKNGAFRELLKVTRTPTLRADGSILIHPGYDGASTLIYLPDAAYPPVKAGPTPADAKAALARLMRPFRAVPFAAEVDRAVFLALILTLLTRHLYPTAPGFMHRAAEAGTGKTLIADAACVIGTGTPASNASAEVLDDPQELRKLLTTWTGAGTALGMFDNMTRGGTLDSRIINRFLTTALYSDRWLGGNDELLARVVTTIVTTGNRTGVKGDATRRFLIADLDAGVEHPENRQFDFDLMAEVERDRVELVAAALTLLRAYTVAGQPLPPACNVPFGSFEGWSQWVRHPLVWAGAADPVSALDKSRDDDEERGTLEIVMSALRGAYGPNVHFTATDAIKKAESGQFDKLRDAIGAPTVAAGRKQQALSPVRLGRYLKGNEKRVVAGFRLVFDPDKDTRSPRYVLRPFPGVPGSSW